MSEQLKSIVKSKYTEIVQNQSSCCEPSCCGDEKDNMDVSESYKHIEGYVEDADYSLGCGIPTEFISIEEGHTVLDLGSGAGNDAFVARRLVGEKGKVYGVDFTEAMVQKANENKTKLGYSNVDFVLGDIENMPIASDSIDIVLSNCVMNLVPNKEKAYQEVYRVMKQGGKFSISDIVLQGDLPDTIKEVAELYAGCVSGAIDQELYIKVIKDAGFTEIETPKVRAINLPDAELLKYISQEELNKFRSSGTGIFSITVTGVKP